LLQTPLALMEYPLLESHLHMARTLLKVKPVAQQLVLPPLLARVEQLMHPKFPETKEGDLQLVQVE
jgi:hypothetical protein